MADNVGRSVRRGEGGSYDHKQYGPWFLAALTVAFVLLFEPVVVRAGGGQAELGALQIGIGLIFLLCASAIAYLCVRDAGDRLSVRFGPLSILGFSIRYEEIESAEAHEPRLGCLREILTLYGLHSHGSGGWSSCGINGHEFVKIRLRAPQWGGPGRDVYVGTNEPERLAEFLRGKIEGAQEETVEADGG